MSEPATPEPALDDIAAAIAAAEGKIPAAVLNAFLPIPKTHLGQTLVPLKAGHELLLSQIGHPLATGEKWEDVDVLMALFIFSRPSRELFDMVAADTFERRFFEFIDSIPPSDISALGEVMVAHWVTARVTAIAMESKHAKGQKKTAVLAGS